MSLAAPTGLNEMPAGSSAVIDSVDGGEVFQRKLLAMGLNPGRTIRRLPAQDRHGPIIVEVVNSRVAIGRRMAARVKVRVKEMTLLLVGNPNVGKSVVFSRLTGLDVTSSNYPGTTVSFLRGDARLAGQRFEVVDVPGAYSLEPTCRAEEVACRILKEGDYDLTLLVLDATNLERNLFFALHVLALGRPALVLLNRCDVARLKGVRIDAESLGRRLGVPVLPFVAVTGEGLREVEAEVERFLAGGLPKPAPVPASDEEKWTVIGRLSREVQTLEHKHPSFLENLAELSVRPSTGLPLAAVTLAGSLVLVRSIGEGLLKWVLEPAFLKLYMPALEGLAGLLPSAPLARQFLMGSTPDPLGSFGALTTGLYVPFVAVLPYIFAFYLVLGFLEDLGYLPRLAVLLDRALHRLGLHGYGTIPLTLGLGCKVPAIMAARVLETDRERFLASALVLLLAPCMPQTAMMFGLLAPHGLGWLAAAFGTILAAGLAAGALLHRLLPGETPELFVEIPPYQWPRPRVLFGKTWVQVRAFLKEAVPLIVLGTLALSLLDAAGFIAGVARWTSPVFSALLGLPGEAAALMALGFLRKDVSIAMLAPMGLGPAQLVVGSVFLTLYMPCLAAFSTLARELGLKDALRIVVLNFVFAVLAGGLLHFLLG